MNQKELTDRPSYRAEDVQKLVSEYPWMQGMEPSKVLEVKKLLDTVYSHNYDVNGVKALLHKADDLLQKYDGNMPLFAVEQRDLTIAGIELAQCVSRIRCGIEEQDECGTRFIWNSADEHSVANNVYEGFCTISHPEHSIIKADIPCIFSSNHGVNLNKNLNSAINNKKTYAFMKFANAAVRDCVKQYIAEHKAEYASIPGRMIIMYIRYLNLDNCNLCDNDNMELSFITDALALGIHKDDGPATTSFFITAKQANRDYPNGTLEAIVMSESDLKYWLP